jgi:hypothetical protein
MLVVRVTGRSRRRSAALSLVAFFSTTACCHGVGTVKTAAADGGEVIDKQAELAELSLTACKESRDDAKCGDVANRLQKIRETAAKQKELAK